MAVIQLHRCTRCGEVWFPRTPGTPKICPACEYERMEAELQEHVKRLRQSGVEMVPSYTGDSQDLPHLQNPSLEHAEEEK